MSSEEHRRRKYQRYPIRWKTALVFDGPDGRPVYFHSQTQDLSAGGTSVFSEQGDLQGTTVTALLAWPEEGLGEVKMIKMRAQVVSSVYVPANGAFRLGLKFLHSNYDAQSGFAAELRAVAALETNVATPAAQAASAAAPAPAPDPAPAVPAGATITSTRLAALRQLAQTKQAETSNEDLQRAINQRVDAAMRRAFEYLKELVENLNVVKPVFARPYPLVVGVPPLDGLAWESGRVDFREKALSPTSKLYEQVGLQFRLDGKKQIEVTRENPAHEKFAQALKDYKIDYTTREFRNARGTLDKTLFKFPCEVVARVVMVGNYQTGKIELTTRHVGRFGILEYKIGPEAITDESLEELAGFILGETATLGLLLRNG